MIASCFFPRFFYKIILKKKTISYFGVKLLALEPSDFFFTFLYIGLSRVQVNQVNPG
jgi:hypothetical protein